MADRDLAEEPRRLLCVAAADVVERVAAALTADRWAVERAAVDELATAGSLTADGTREAQAFVVDRSQLSDTGELARLLETGCGNDRFTVRTPVIALVQGPADETALLELLGASRIALGVDICVTGGIESQLPARLRLLEERVLALSGAAHISRDSLTGLYSREAMRGHIKRVIDDPPAEVAAAYILDLDGFKPVNDSFGHRAGDAVIASIGRMMLRSPELRATACRLGGDEFAGIVFGRDKGEVAGVLDDLRRRIAGSQFDGGSSGRISVTASIGYMFIEPDVDSEAVFLRADQALYAAKSSGRNRIACYDLLWETSDRDHNQAALAHFENVTRVWTDHMSELIRSLGRRTMEVARRTAETDGLTGLYNRAYFDRRMARELENARRSGSPLSIGLLDIDDFHGVNMEFGYPTGDLALKAVAELARNHSRSTDWIARYGGEEFVIVMPSTGGTEAALVAERYRAALEASEIPGYETRTVRLTVSVGVASAAELAEVRSDARAGGPDAPGADRDTVALVQIASDRVIRAKTTGKNRVVGASGVTAGDTPPPGRGRDAEPRPLEILVVDDTEHARTQVEHSLDRAGVRPYRVTWASTRAEVEALRGGEFDLAFIDFFLSKDHTYGTDVLAEVRARTLVGFSSKLEASVLIETEAKRLAFVATAAIRKDKDRLENEPLEQFLQQALRHLL